MSLLDSLLDDKMWQDFLEHKKSSVLSERELKKYENYINAKKYEDVAYWDEICRIFARCPDGMGGVQGPDAVLAERRRSGQGTDAGNGAADIVPGISPVHIGPGMGRYQEQTLGQISPEGIDEAIGAIFHLAHRPHRCVDQHRIRGQDAHGLDLRRQLFFCVHFIFPPGQYPSANP